MLSDNLEAKFCIWLKPAHELHYNFQTLLDFNVGQTEKKYYLPLEAFTNKF